MLFRIPTRKCDEVVVISNRDRTFRRSQTTHQKRKADITPASHVYELKSSIVAILLSRLLCVAVNKNLMPYHGGTRVLDKSNS
jgi:hypothetical protein